MSKLLERGVTIFCEQSLSGYVCDLDPGPCCRGEMERLEAQHWSGYALDEAVVLLEDVVEEFDLQDIDDAPRTGELEDRIHALRTR